jgi:hypothetical protein
MNYQFLKTIHKYIKMIDLKQVYPEKYQQLIVLFMQKTAEMINYCNEETVHVPLEGLAFLSKVSKLSILIIFSWIMSAVLRCANK